MGGAWWRWRLEDDMKIGDIHIHIYIEVYKQVYKDLYKIT